MSGISWGFVSAEKNRHSAKRLIDKWSKELYTYQDACDLLLPGIVSEIVPPNYKMNDPIGGLYEEGFREKCARLVLGIWFRRLVHEIAAQVFDEAVRQFGIQMRESGCPVPDDSWAHIYLAEVNPHSISIEMLYSQEEP